MVSGPGQSLRWATAILSGATALFACVGVGNAQPSVDDLYVSSELETRSTCSTPPKGVWQPAEGATWNIKLLSPIASPSTVNRTISVWDIDLFDNTATAIKTMHGRGARVICYFSAGSYEDWRPDAASFKPADLGEDLDGWPGEKWLNIRSANVRKIMTARLDLAVKKGCDGVDPDNVDGYDNDNGLGLTEANSVNYMTFLATQAHNRGLAIGLKNAGDIIPDLLPCMQWSVNEQCIEYDECDTYAPFVHHGKPVFHIEYPKGSKTNNNKPVSQSKKTKICDDTSAAGFSTIIKNMDLDGWIQRC